MSDWNRRTREVSVESLPTETTNAIQRHIEQHHLGPILSDALMCVYTDSEKTKKGLFGRAETVRMAAILTPRWLVWSVEQPDAKAAVLSAQLIHVTIQDYAQTSFAELIPDSGIQVTGLFTNAGEGASAFIGLEENLAGNSFKDLTIKTAQEAKK
jgi:hypothetical protein